jgi:hypothetical protein
MTLWISSFIRHVGNCFLGPSSRLYSQWLILPLFGTYFLYVRVGLVNHCHDGSILTENYIPYETCGGGTLKDLRKTSLT